MENKSVQGFLVCCPVCSEQHIKLKIKQGEKIIFICDNLKCNVTIKVEVKKTENNDFVLKKKGGTNETNR